MIECASCNHPVEIERLRCAACGIAYEGRFAQPRLARLEPAQLRLVEQIVLAAGNLKEVAGELGVSYPTLRKRVDGVIESLRAIKTEDDKKAQILLGQIERGNLAAEEAARLIREMNGGT